MKFNFSTKTVFTGICLSLFLALGGCATSDMKELVSNGNAVSMTKTKLHPTNPSQVKIYDVKPKHYQVVGRISADNYSMIGMEHSQKSVMSQLQKQAASVGGNGVININQGTTQTTAEAILVKK